MNISRHNLNILFFVIFVSIFVFSPPTNGLCAETSKCKISKISLSTTGQTDVITIQVSGYFEKLVHFILPAPPRLVLDLYGVEYRNVPKPTGSTNLILSPPRIGKYPEKTRVVFDLSANNIKYNVSENPGLVSVTLISEKYPRPKNNVSFLKEARQETAAEEKAQSESKENTREISWRESQQEGTINTQTGDQSVWEKPAEDEAKTDDRPSWGKNEEVAQKNDSPWAQEDNKEIDAHTEKPPWEKVETQDPQTDTTIPEWEEKEKVQAKPFTFSGKIWNKSSVDVKQENLYEEDFSNHTEIFLQGKYEANSWITALVSVEINYFAYQTNGDWDSDFDPDLFDAYVNFSGDYYNLRLGQQIVKWGKADEISPLDILNPEDYRDGPMRPRDERKMPIPMVNLEVFKDVYKVQFIYIPFFRKSKFDFKDDDWAFFDHYQEEVGYFELNKTDVPYTLDNGEVGLRVSGTIGKLDYAFSYLYTRSDLPSIGTMTVSPFIPLPVHDATLKKLAAVSAALNEPIPLSYDITRVTGFEFETTLGDFGVRGEAAYFHKLSFINDRLEKTQCPVLQYALGFDYMGSESFYLNLQFLQSIIFDYDKELIFTEKTTNLAFLKVSQGLFDEMFELGLRAYYNFTDHDYYYNPMITFKYWEDVQLELGADILGGSLDTTMGIFRQNDQIYLIFRYYF